MFSSDLKSLARISQVSLPMNRGLFLTILFVIWFIHIASNDMGIPGLNNSFTTIPVSVLNASWQSRSSGPIPVVSVSKKMNITSPSNDLNIFNILKESF
jgi:hypothetical protein